MAVARRKAETSGIVLLWKPLAFGTVAGVVAIVGILMLFSLLLSSNSPPQGVLTPMAIAALCIGSFVGGGVSAKLAGEKGLIMGAGTGLLLFFVLLIAGTAVQLVGLDALLFLRLTLLLISASLGGVVGVNLKKRRR